ncbi:MAG TPA: hypothetical protein PLP49_01970 [Anaerohalosphaeraceae bacterium]|nr:hypothetical protein [Anaerohalosphaeraceae bacterium]HPB92840.1 hypothetical protein [Anaerohalosphaeraceae bacterium]HRT23195.1 hypothetical protein [Anaerohalosphaeraceae bacterium]
MNGNEMFSQKEQGRRFGIARAVRLKKEGTAEWVKALNAVKAMLKT